MKCSIAEDLLPLYVEEICSEETRKELEEHIKNCKECRAKLQAYKTDVTLPPVPGDNTATEDTASRPDEKLAVDSMKKVKKKLSVRKTVTLLLSLVLIVVLGTIGILFWGERTGKSLNFTTISNIITLNKISRALSKGDLEPLLERTHFDLQTAYCIDDPEAGSMEERQKMLEDYQRAKLEEAFAYYFKGEEFQYEIVQIEYIYENHLATGVSKGFMENMMNPSGIITVRYYNQHNSVDIAFIQEGDRKFTYEDMINGIYENVPTFDSLETNGFALSIIAHSLKRENGKSIKSASALTMIIHYDKISAESLTSNGEYDRNERAFYSGREQINHLFEQGYTVTEMLYQPVGYDHDKKCPIYKCQFRVENETGDFLLMEQKFDYAEQNLFVMDGEPARELCASEDIPQSVREQALRLFAPIR